MKCPATLQFFDDQLRAVHHRFVHRIVDQITGVAEIEIESSVHNYVWRFVAAVVRGIVIAAAVKGGRPSDKSYAAHLTIGRISNSRVWRSSLEPFTLQGSEAQTVDGSIRRY